MLRPGALLVLVVGGTDNGLDLVAVDKASDIRVGDLGSGEAVITRIEYTSYQL